MLTGRRPGCLYPAEGLGTAAWAVLSATAAAAVAVQTSCCLAISASAAVTPGAARGAGEMSSRIRAAVTLAGILVSAVAPNTRGDLGARGPAGAGGGAGA